MRAGDLARPPAVGRARGRLSGTPGQFKTTTSTTGRGGMAADTLQAMTAAISPSGLTTYLQHFINTTYPSQLNGRSVADDTFTQDNIPLALGGRIMPYKAELNSGVISGATAQFISVTSQGGGKFTIV